MRTSQIWLVADGDALARFVCSVEWIHLRIDWINFGKTKKFCIIGKLIFVPEVEVKSMLF